MRCKEEAGCWVRPLHNKITTNNAVVVSLSLPLPLHEPCCLSLSKRTCRSSLQGSVCELCEPPGSKRIHSSVAEGPPLLGSAGKEGPWKRHGRVLSYLVANQDKRDSALLAFVGCGAILGSLEDCGTLDYRGGWTAGLCGCLWVRRRVGEEVR